MKTLLPIEVAVAFPSSNILGEGPLWHNERQSFFWVDIEGRSIHELKWPGKIIGSWVMPQRVGMIVPENKNDVVVALEEGIARFNLETKELYWLAEIEKNIFDNRPNDGKCDSEGRLWLGTMDRHCKEGAGSLYCIKEDLSVTKKLSNLTISNGMAWSADNKRLYFTDSSSYKIDCFLFNAANAAIHFEKEIIHVPEDMGLPDGMAIDDEDMLWVAHWNGFAVRRWNPHSGELLATIQFPVPQVSSCCFGGENLDELLITTARAGLSKEQLMQYPLSGHVFIAKPGVKGTAAHKFKCITTKNTERTHS